MLRARILLAALLVSAPLAGCLSLGTEPPPREGVVVTGQPALDAFDRVNETNELVGIPDWAGVAEPVDATRLGRPFTIPAESVLGLSPRLVLDQPHPLVAGPSRAALEEGLAGTGITYQRLPVEPRFSTIHATLNAVENATGTPAQDAWSTLRTNLDTLNDTLEGADRPNVLVLFPAGLTAGTGTDINLLLNLAQADNVAADAGLEGYKQIGDEPIQRANLDYVLATSTMKDTPSEIANKPMFEGTPIEDNASRILVIDPSRTMRVGPYLDEGAGMIATWLHPSLPGPRIQATITPYEPAACGTLTVTTQAPNATVTLLGTEHDPGPIPLPDVDPGHYRVRIHATDTTGTAFVDNLITVERSQCDAS